MEAKQCEIFLEYVLSITSQMVECGAETRRAENTALRLVECYGFELKCANAISSMVEVSIKAPDGAHYTQAVRVLSTGTDLGKLERLNALARKICAEKPSVDQIGSMIADEKKIVYPHWMEFIGYVVMTFGFAVFFGGDVFDGIAAMLVAAVMFGTNYIMNRRLQLNQNRLFYTFFACFVSGGLAIALNHIGLGHHTDKIMIGAVMLFMPGSTMVNGVRDLFYRDIITGLYRIIEALMMAVIIAAGFAVSIVLFGGGAV